MFSCWVYRAYPASGSKWGCNGIGDDLYSYAYDGLCLWTGGKRKQVRAADTHLLQKVRNLCIEFCPRSSLIQFALNHSSSPSADTLQAKGK